MDRKPLEALYAFIVSELYEAADEDYLEYLCGLCASEEGFPETADKDWCHEELVFKILDAWTELTEGADEGYAACLMGELSDEEKELLSHVDDSMLTDDEYEQQCAYDLLRATGVPFTPDGTPLGIG